MAWLIYSEALGIATGDIVRIADVLSYQVVAVSPPRYTTHKYETLIVRDYPVADIELCDSNRIRHTRAVYRAGDRWFAEVWQGQPDEVVLEMRAGRGQMRFFAREQQDATPYQFQHGVTYEPTEGVDPAWHCDRCGLDANLPHRQSAGAMRFSPACPRCAVIQPMRRIVTMRLRDQAALL